MHLELLEIIVLDEADRLLELGFREEVRFRLSLCSAGRELVGAAGVQVIATGLDSSAGQDVCSCTYRFVPSHMRSHPLGQIRLLWVTAGRAWKYPARSVRSKSIQLVERTLMPFAF